MRYFLPIVIILVIGVFVMQQRFINEEDIVLISDPRVTAMPVKPIDDPMVDVREEAPWLLISDQYIEVNPHLVMMRKTVLDKLAKAREKLPDGLRFVLSEGYRPLSVQQQFFDNYYAELEKKHPDLDEKALTLLANEWIANPRENAPHSTGGAFDINLIDENDNLLNMGTILDAWPSEVGDRNQTYSQHISDEAMANREILIEVLSEQGLVNYPEEWWHWSYGDQYWAYISEADAALYTTVRMDD